MSARLTLDALLRLLIVEMQSAFLGALQGIIDQAILKDVIEAVQNNDAQKAFELLGFNPAALRPLTAAIERIYERSGEWVAEGYPRRPGSALFRFNVQNDSAQQYLRTRSSGLVSRITDEARLNVKEVLTAGMERGANPRNTALNIIGRVNQQTGKREGGIIGLTNSQERWSRSAGIYLEQLSDRYLTMELRDKRFDSVVEKAIASKKPLDPALIQRLVDRYRSNALRFRGENISRTESLSALAAADYESTRQILATGNVREKDITREWDSAGDARVRPDHKHMDGQTVGINEPFRAPDGSYLMYPGDTSLGAPARQVIDCRCRVRTKIDWIGGLVKD